MKKPTKGKKMTAGAGSAKGRMMKAKQAGGMTKMRSGGMAMKKTYRKGGMAKRGKCK